MFIVNVFDNFFSVSVLLKKIVVFAGNWVLSDQCQITGNVVKIEALNCVDWDSLEVAIATAVKNKSNHSKHQYCIGRHRKRSHNLTNSTLCKSEYLLRKVKRHMALMAYVIWNLLSLKPVHSLEDPLQMGQAGRIACFHMPATRSGRLTFCTSTQ